MKLSDEKYSNLETNLIVSEHNEHSQKVHNLKTYKEVSERQSTVAERYLMFEEVES
jgi:hypothetical protein